MTIKKRKRRKRSVERERSFELLMMLECYAFRRWSATRSEFWLRLGGACNRAVKAHPEYRGVR